MFTDLLIVVVCFGLFTLAMVMTAYSTPKSICHITKGRFVSSCLVTLCHLYTMAFYIWPPENTKNIYNSYVLYTYILFFSGAITCLPMALLSMYREHKLCIVYVSLSLMDISSVFLCIFSITTSTDIAYKIFLVFSGFYITIHHVMFDTVLWWAMFSVHKSAILDMGYYEQETI